MTIKQRGNIGGKLEKFEKKILFRKRLIWNNKFSQSIDAHINLLLYSGSYEEDLDSLKVVHNSEISCARGVSSDIARQTSLSNKVTVLRATGNWLESCLELYKIRM